MVQQQTWGGVWSATARPAASGGEALRLLLRSGMPRPMPAAAPV